MKGPKTTAKHRILRTIGAATLWTLIFLSVALLLTGIFIRKQWGQITVDQMLTNIAGAGQGGGYVWITVFWVIVAPLAITALLFAGRRLWI